MTRPPGRRGGGGRSPGRSKPARGGKVKGGSGEAPGCVVLVLVGAGLLIGSGAGVALLTAVMAR